MPTFYSMLAVFERLPQLAQEASVYFSQNGEDIIATTLLAQEEEKGVVVDFGAYHPYRFSNTFSLYLQGWRGVNVDANADVIALFEALRVEDVNIHALVGPREEELEYFCFAEGAYNTINPDAAKSLLARDQPEFRLLSSTRMRSVTPNQIFAEYVGERKFDFLTIDVEGLDEEILYSIDFERYRPKLISVELDMKTWSREPMRSFLDAKGYEPVSHAVHSAFFRKKW